MAGNRVSKSKLNNEIKKLPLPAQEHCKRCKLIARFLLERISGEDWFLDAKLNHDHILSAVYYHDIGKTLLSKDNIYAEHNVTSQKQAIYRSHIEKGVDLVEMLCDVELEKFDEHKLEKYIYHAITEHHEAADGCGFPKRLNYKKMSITGKITAISDVFDNMFFMGVTEKQNYDELIDKLLEMSGKGLDAELLNVMLSDKEALLSFIGYIESYIKNKRRTDNYGLQMRFYEIRNIIENEVYESYVDFVINDPFYGIVKPEVYMPVAEISSQTLRLTLLMVERLCITIDKISERGGTPLPLSIPIEAKCFEAKKFVSEMQKLILKYNVKEDLICLVVDEKAISELGEDIDYINAFANLRNSGYKMAVKMMSEGASLISSLDTLPVDYLFIDGSYTNRINTNANAYGIASGLLDIAHNLNLSVVFLGVDSHATENSLLKMHARYAIGNLFGMPLKENEYISYIVRGGDPTS